MSTNDAKLLRDPHDNTSTLGWDNRTTENQQECLKLYKRIMKRVNIKYVIRINLKGPRVNDGVRDIWPHIIYPLEFNSDADAWDYLCLSPDPDLHPDNVKSWSIETVRKPKPQPLPEPKVRRTNLVKEPACRSISRRPSKRTRSAGP